MAPSPPNSALVDLAIGVGAVEAAALAAAGRSVPAEIPVRALIDTGAKRTCVDARAIAALRVRSTDVRNVRTVSTGATTLVTRVFDVSIVAAAPSRAVIAPDPAVLEADLAHYGIQCLLGRDALQACVLVYDGPGRRFSLAF